MAVSQMPEKVTRVSGPSKSLDGKHSPGELLTIQELAERLTVSVGCIRAWRLPGGPRPVRWCKSRVDRVTFGCSVGGERPVRHAKIARNASPTSPR